MCIYMYLYTHVKCEKIINNKNFDKNTRLDGLIKLLG